MAFHVYVASGATFSSVPGKLTAGVPSPQLMVAVRGSSQPGSVMTPLLTVTAVFSGLGPLVTIAGTVGGTFVIVTFAVLQTLAGLSSLAQIVIVYTPSVP